MSAYRRLVIERAIPIVSTVSIATLALASIKTFWYLLPRPIASANKPPLGRTLSNSLFFYEQESVHQNDELKLRLPSRTRQVPGEGTRTFSFLSMISLGYSHGVLAQRTFESPFPFPVGRYGAESKVSRGFQDPLLVITRHSPFFDRHTRNKTCHSP